MQRISINGVAAEYISVMDRGLHYGDGVFETIACVNHELQFWEQHMARMREAAEKLKIDYPGDDVFLQDIKMLLDENPPGKSCVIKLMLTRGVGERGYRVPAKVLPNRIAICSGSPENIESRIRVGARVYVCDTRLPMSSQLAGIKHLNRLENVLARNEWQDEYDEGLMLDDSGNVVEATMTNLFAAKNGVLYTPSLERTGIRGIIRQQVLSIADEHAMELKEVDIKLEELGNMDEIMLTNSVLGIWPVSELNNKKFPAAEGKMSQMLSVALSKRTQKYAQTLA